MHHGGHPIVRQSAFTTAQEMEALMRGLEDAKGGGPTNPSGESTGVSQGADLSGSVGIPGADNGSGAVDISGSGGVSIPGTGTTTSTDNTGAGEVPIGGEVPVNPNEPTDTATDNVNDGSNTDGQ